MLDYFDRLETELRDATAHAHPPHTRRTPARLVAPVASVVLAAAVALAVVVLAGHRTGPAGTSALRSAPSSPQPCIAIGTPRCLLEQYQLIRRPQTRAERAIRLTVPAAAYFAGQALRDVHITLMPALTRRVELGHRDRLIVFVFHSSIGPPDFYLAAELVTPNGSAFLPAQWPFILAGSSSAHGNWMLWATRPTSRKGLSVALLPDRVATVRWTYARTGTFTIPVHDNVALAITAPRSGDPTVSEYGPTGRILARTPVLTTFPPPTGRHRTHNTP